VANVLIVERRGICVHVYKTQAAYLHKGGVEAHRQSVGSTTQAFISCMKAYMTMHSAISSAVIIEQRGVHTMDRGIMCMVLNAVVFFIISCIIRRCVMKI
jgi:hypothetical protein